MNIQTTIPRIVKPNFTTPIRSRVQSWAPTGCVIGPKKVTGLNYANRPKPFAGGDIWPGHTSHFSETSEKRHVAVANA